MTVAELGVRMSSYEVAEWLAHDDLCAWEHEQARKQAEAKAKARR